MRDDYTDATVIIDESGSMGGLGLVVETINAFNHFVEEQKKAPGLCKLTLILFDSEHPYRVICSALDIKHVVPLTDRIYIPGAMTPLNDCVGSAITSTGNRLSALAEQERPGKVIFLIITDGLENASKEYPGHSGRSRIKDMIEHQKTKYNWQFTFLGAGFDVEAEAATMGIHVAAASPMPSMHNLGKAMRHYTDNTTAYRGGMSSSMDWSTTQKDDIATEDKEDSN